MRELPAATIFTTAEALPHGWTSSALKNAVRQGRLVRVRRGVYSVAQEQSLELRVLAAACAHPTLPISHESALLFRGLPLLGTPPPLPQVTVPPRSNANLPGIHPYRAQLRAQDVTMVDGVLLTSVARSLVDVARHRPIGVAVAAMDAALHSGSATRGDIADVLAFCRTWIGISRARRAYALSDGRAESPLESISRLAFPGLGLPAPTPQAVVLDRHAHFAGRVDFYWDEFGVVGEADGRGKYDARPVLTHEKERQEALEDLGLVAVRWQWDHVQRRTDVLRAKVERGFERGRRRDLSGFPRLWTLGTSADDPSSGKRAPDRPGFLGTGH